MQRRETRAKRAERRRQKQKRGGRRAETGTGRKRPGATVVQDESEQDESESETDDGDEVGAGLEPEIRAGGRVRNRVESDDECEDGSGSAGSAKRRCQEGAAEARGSLGGGGKRGWLA